LKETISLVLVPSPMCCCTELLTGKCPSTFKLGLMDNFEIASYHLTNVHTTSLKETRMLQVLLLLTLDWMNDLFPMHLSI